MTILTQGRELLYHPQNPRSESTAGREPLDGERPTLFQVQLDYDNAFPDILNRCTMNKTLVKFQDKIQADFKGGSQETNFKTWEAKKCSIGVVSS